MNIVTIAETHVSRLSKKPKLLKKNVTDAFDASASQSVFSRHKTGSHFGIRERTLRCHRAKVFRSVQSFASSRISQQHGVELTDDIVVRDLLGNRIPRVIMPIDDIDQLPQFREG